MKTLNTEEILAVAGGYWEGERQENGDGESGGQDLLKPPVWM